MKKYKVILCLILLFPVIAKSQKPTQDAPCLAADIVFVLDNSTSINSMRLLHIDAVEAILEQISPEVRKIQYGIVSFHKTAITELDITSDKAKIDTVVSALKKRKDTQDGTFVLNGMKLATTMLRTSSNEFDHFKIIILMSDGQFNDNFEVQAWVNSSQFQKENILVYSLGYGDEVLDNSSFDPISRTYRISFMNVFTTNLKSISQYFDINYIELVKTIHRKGKCL